MWLCLSLSLLPSLLPFTALQCPYVPTRASPPSPPTKWGALAICGRGGAAGDDRREGMARQREKDDAKCASALVLRAVTRNGRTEGRLPKKKEREKLRAMGKNIPWCDGDSICGGGGRRNNACTTSYCVVLMVLVLVEKHLGFFFRSLFRSFVAQPAFPKSSLSTPPPTHPKKCSGSAFDLEARELSRFCVAKRTFSVARDTPDA